MRALVIGDGVPIVAKGCYRVSATWQKSDVVRVENVSRRGVVTVRIIDGGVLSGGVRVDLSGSRAAGLSWERLPDGSPGL